MDPKPNVSELIDKYLLNKCSEQEKILVEKIYFDEFRKRRVHDIVSGNEIKVSIWNKIQKDLPVNNIRGRVITWSRIGIAASIALCFSLGYYFYSSSISSLHKGTYVNEIGPGKNKAMLTLSNGQKIFLKDSTEEQFAELSGVKITKTAGGQIIYDSGPALSKRISAVGNQGLKNTLTTANGEQYKLRLPDGTMVWLNAGSSIKYPVNFNGVNSRDVDLIGEAYFEVAKDVKHPFFVKTNKQTVEVLGTHFNISSYSDEMETKTTLIEGAVKISISNHISTNEPLPNVILIPGQQSVLSNHVIRVIKANTNEVMGWKNGYFYFEDEKIQPIMRKISRWYNVEIVYQGELPTDEFGGRVNRFGNVSQVLNKLELTNKVHFKIDGRRITVTK